MDMKNINFTQIKKLYRCHMCKTWFTNENDVYTHITKGQHKKHVKDIKSRITWQAKNPGRGVKRSLTLTKRQKKKEFRRKKFEQIIKEQEKSNKVKFKMEKNDEVINLVDKKSLDECNLEKQGSSDTTNLEEQEKLPVDYVPINNFYCVKCDIYVEISDEELFQCHCLFHFHKEQPNTNFDIIEYHPRDKKTLFIICLLCDCQLHTERTLVAHLRSIKHRDKFNDLTSKINSNPKDFIPKQMYDVHPLKCYSFNPDHHTSVATLCEFDNLTDSNKKTQSKKLKKLDKQRSLLKDYEPILTEEKFSEFIEKYSSIKEASFIKPYRCFLCDMSCENITGLLKHYNAVTHKQRLTHFHLSSIGNQYISMCLELGSQNIYKVNDDEIERLQFELSLIYNCKGICIPCDEELPLDEPKLLQEHLQDSMHIHNLCLMEKRNKEALPSSLQLRILDLAKSYLMQERPDRCICLACDESVPKLSDDLKDHISSTNHVARAEFWKKKAEPIKKMFSTILSEPWYYAQRYYCQVCNEDFEFSEIRFAEHLFSEHAEELKLCTSNNRTNICYSCLGCWYGISDYGKHCVDSIHTLYMGSYTDTYCEMNSEAKALLTDVHDKAYDLMMESNTALFEGTKTKILLNLIEKRIKPLYPEAKAHTFGSRTYYLGFPTTELDVFLDCEKINNNNDRKKKIQKYISQLEGCFFPPTEKSWIKHDAWMPRVPIIQLENTTIPGFICNIHFLSGLEVEKSTVVRYYVIASEHCRKLILYLKKWFFHCDLYEPRCNRITNGYAISWCAIFYLQTIGMLPSFHTIILRDGQRIVDGWRTSYERVTPNAFTTNKSFKELLEGFFLYYAKFNYRTDVACPLLGSIIKKRDLLNFWDLPNEMEIYKSRLQLKKSPIFGYDLPMCIQDPIELSDNITGSFSKPALRNFRRYCSMSYEILSSQICTLVKN